MTAPTIIHADDDWEVVNDDGFIYKRQKRDPSSSGAQIPEYRTSRKIPSLGVQDDCLQRKKKKEMLLALKARYSKEIEEWESLLSKQTLSSGQCHWLDESPECSVAEEDSAKEPFNSCQAFVRKLSFQRLCANACMKTLLLINWKYGRVHDLSFMIFFLLKSQICK
eukprot:c20348_g1_i1 orf=414-911(-)